MEHLTICSQFHTVSRMDQSEQAAHFATELEKLVDRYRDEYDLLYPTIIGMLEIQSHMLMVEALGDDEDDSDYD